MKIKCTYKIIELNNSQLNNQIFSKILSVSLICNFFPALSLITQGQFPSLSLVPSPSPAPWHSIKKKYLKNTHTNISFKKSSVLNNKTKKDWCYHWHMLRDMLSPVLGNFLFKCDTWNGTCDMWHMTRDAWHVAHRESWTLSQNTRSLLLRFASYDF